MKCTCGATVTQKTIEVAAQYDYPDCTLCLVCLSKELGIPYNTLLDRMNGIDGCRDCTKHEQREKRRRLLGM